MAKTIILIDDDQDDLDIITEAINHVDKSIVPVVFKDPEKALQAIINERTVLPNHIFIDNDMPRVTGDKILIQIRSIPEFDKVKVTMLCTSISPKDAAKYKRNGANFTFEKPYAYQSYHDIFKGIFSSL
ncbi:MAG TPA: response regulator [Chryseolinea sp.]|nr:response regulator [Chryseolinea sp.]